MPFLVLILFLAVEVAGIWFVGELVGDHFLVIVAALSTCFLGGWLLGRARERMDPAAMQQLVLMGGLGSVVNTVMVPMAGGVMLLVPGFLTDLIGASLLIPATRRLWVPVVGKVFARVMRSQMQRGGMPNMPNMPGGGAGGAPDPKAMKELLAQLELMGQGGGPKPGGGRPQTRVNRRGDGEKVRDADFEVID